MILTPNFGKGQEVEAKKWIKGLKIAEILRLKPIGRRNLPCVYKTDWGMKSALGIYETVKNIINE